MFPSFELSNVGLIFFAVASGVLLSLLTSSHSSTEPSLGRMKCGLHHATHAAHSTHAHTTHSSHAAAHATHTVVVVIVAAPFFLFFGSFGDEQFGGEQ